MWRITILAGLMFFGLHALASEPRKYRATGTAALATTDELPKAIIERIKKIESKKRPQSRTWSGEQAKALMAKPDFNRVRQMAVDKGAKFHSLIADDMNLNQKHKAQFLSILASGHEARIDALIYTLKQGSAYPKRLPALARAGKLPEELKKADPTITNRKLLKLLGKERFSVYLDARDRASGLNNKGGAK